MRTQSNPERQSSVFFLFFFSKKAQYLSPSGESGFVPNEKKLTLTLLGKTAQSRYTKVTCSGRKEDISLSLSFSIAFSFPSFSLRHTL